MTDSFTPIKWKPRELAKKIINEARKYIKEQESSVTVRGIFYHLVSQGIVESTKDDYSRVGRNLTRARKAGYIPFSVIEDRSRSFWKVPLFSNVTDFLQEKMSEYWFDTWMNQDIFMIVLLEKATVAHIVWEVASYYNVPMLPSKGFGSWSVFWHQVLPAIRKYKSKELVVLVLGDFNPSGVIGIPKHHKNIMNFFGTVPHSVERVALNKEQVIEHKLPMRMAKEKDPNYDRFMREYGAHSVELDALQPKILKEYLEASIQKYLNIDQFTKDQDKEKKQKEALENALEEVEEILDLLEID